MSDLDQFGCNTLAIYIRFQDYTYARVKMTTNNFFSLYLTLELHYFGTKRKRIKIILSDEKQFSKFSLCKSELARRHHWL